MIAHLMGTVASSVILIFTAPTVSWNPADKDSTITLSNNNRTATKTTGLGWVSVRADVSKTSGLYYFESRFEEFSGSFIGAGLGNGTMTLANYVGQNTNGFGVVSNGDFFYNAASVASGVGVFSEGDVLCIAVNLNTARVWFKRNGGSWFGAATAMGAAVVGDPETGTNGRPYTVAGALFPVASLQWSSGPDSQTGRFKATHFSYIPPVGFSAWEDNSFAGIGEQRMHVLLGVQPNQMAVDQQRMYTLLGVPDNHLAVDDQRMYTVIGAGPNQMGVGEHRMYVIVKP